MAQAFIPNWLYVVLKMKEAVGDDMLMTFSYRYASDNPPTATELLEWATDWWNHHATELRACMTTNVLYQSVTVRDLDSEAGLEVTYDIPSGTRGTRGGETAGLASAIVASLRSFLPGRRYRGRSFFGGISESASGNGTIDGNLLADIVQAIGLIVSFSGTGHIATNGVVASRVGLVLTDILTVVVDFVIDSQRRRNISRGR